MNTNQGTATTTATKENEYDVTTAEFKEILNDLAKKNGQLMVLASAIGQLNKNDAGLQFKNGEVFSRRDLKSLRSQFSKKTKSLAKYFVQAKKKKKVRRKGTSKGFHIPIYVSQAMQNFFAEANLGYVVPFDVQSGQLNNSLLLTSDRITTRAILTPLFSIYAFLNGMQRDKNSLQYLTATNLMNKYFNDTYDSILQSEQEKAYVAYEKAGSPQNYPMENGRPSLVNKKGEPIPFFDPMKFRFASLQSIVKFHAIPSKGLDENAKQTLNSEQVKTRLAEEQKVVSCNLFYYKNQRKIQTSELNAEDKEFKLRDLGEVYSRCMKGEDKKSLKFKVK